MDRVSEPDHAYDAKTGELTWLPVDESPSPVPGICRYHYDLIAATILANANLPWDEVVAANTRQLEVGAWFATLREAPRGA
jgi:hypothetical protein